MLRSERILIDGPAGALEVLVEDPAPDAVPAFGVICHPHPLHGGTLDNKVVYMLARALQEVGLPTLRFNYRGVGRSAGGYDEGRGETDDALAVAAWGAQRWPGVPLWFVGFSFGGFVAINASRQRATQRVIVAAPAVGRLSKFKVEGPPCPWLLLQGDADEVIDAADVLEWSREQLPAPDIVVVPGASHFFDGQLVELRDAVVAWAGRSPTR